MMKRYCSISKLIISLLILICYLFIIPSTHAEIIERVVGIINDDVILMSEFDAAYNTARSTGTSMSEAEFLDDMINRKLILEQARRFRFEGAERRKVSDNMLIEKYLERRIKAFIHISFDLVENYYIENEELFKGVSFFEIRDEIEAFLVDERLGIKILEHIQELRDDAYIRVQLKF